MIILHEIHLFVILLITGIITYILFSYFQNCDISCKINYYKYQNFHENKKIKKIIPIIDNTPTFDVKNIIIDNNNNHTSVVGDRTSSHSSSIQGNNISFSNADEYINKLLNY